MYEVQFYASTSATWAQAIELTDARTNLDFDVPDGAVFTLAIEGEGSRQTFSTTDGTLTRPRDNVVQWSIPASSLSQWDAGRTYRVGMTMTTSTGTVQLMYGTLAMIDGVV